MIFLVQFGSTCGLHWVLVLTWKIFVVLGESFIRSGNGGGGGESTSSSGDDTEHERDAHRDRDELRERDFVHESLQLDVSSECGDILPFRSWCMRWWFWCSYVLLLSSSSESGVFTKRLMLKFNCSAKKKVERNMNKMINRFSRRHQIKICYTFIYWSSSLVTANIKN